MNLKSAFILSNLIFFPLLAHSAARDGIPSYPVKTIQDAEAAINNLANKVLPQSGGDDVFFIDRKNKDVQISTLTVINGITVNGTAPASSINANSLYADMMPKVIGRILNTGTPTIGFGINISSVTDNGAGDVVVNFDRDFANTNYVCNATVFVSGNRIIQTRNRTQQNINVVVRDPTTGNGDDQAFDIVCFGLQ